jgi:hypothetical protein
MGTKEERSEKARSEKEKPASVLYYNQTWEELT